MILAMWPVTQNIWVDVILVVILAENVDSCLKFRLNISPEDRHSETMHANTALEYNCMSYKLQVKFLHKAGNGGVKKQFYDSL